MKNSLLILLSLINIPFIIGFILLYKRFKKVLKDFSQLSIDNLVMKEYIDILNSKEKPITEDVADKENFIKFLSDSRDWAFTYIEKVQKELQQFTDLVEPDLDYFDEYGEVGSAYPHYDSMKRISKAYKELKQLLPEEIKDVK